MAIPGDRPRGHSVAGEPKFCRCRICQEHFQAEAVALARQACKVDTLFADGQSGAMRAIAAADGLDTCLDEDLTPLGRICVEAGDHKSRVKLTGQDFLALPQGARRGHFRHGA